MGLVCNESRDADEWVQRKEQGAQRPMSGVAQVVVGHPIREGSAAGARTETGLRGACPEQVSVGPGPTSFSLLRLQGNGGTATQWERVGLIELGRDSSATRGACGGTERQSLALGG